MTTKEKEKKGRKESLIGGRWQASHDDIRLGDDLDGHSNNENDSNALRCIFQGQGGGCQGQSRAEVSRGDVCC